MNNRVVPELEILTVLLDRTSKSIIVNVQPHPVQRPFWQASLFHLPPKFTSTVKKYGNGNGVRELYYILLFRIRVVLKGKNLFITF